MKLLDLAPLFGALCNFVLAVFVLWQDRKSRLNQVFFLWGICITIWNIGTFALFLRPSPAIAYEWARFLQMGVIFIPCTLLHLSLLIANIERPRVITALYALGGLLALSNLCGYFISNVRSVGYAYYSVAGPGFWIFACTFSLTGVSIAVLFWKRRELPPLRRKRLNGMIVAQTLLVALGTNDILPILGIDHYPFTDRAIYPYGSLAAVFYGIIVGYSVLQHQILDVQIAVGRLAAHFIRFLFLAAIAVALQLVITLFEPEIGTFSIVTSIGVLLFSSLTASILFPRLIGSTAEDLERRLLGDRFEYQDQVRSFLESMTWYSDVHLLLNDVHELFTRTLRLASYQVILRDETNRVFTITRANPDQAPRQLPDLKVESPVFQYFAQEKADYLSLRANALRAGEPVLAREAREQLREFDGEFCLPLISENEPFGLLIVGEKVGGAPYTATDLTLLLALVKNMTLMIDQIRLKTQILQAEELELLGRMSCGVAHDLNNLLTPISTLLQLSSEGVPQEAMEELLPVALRNVKAMRAYIKESLFFSENLRPDFQVGRLDMLIGQAAEVARNSRDKVVDIVTENPGEVLVEMDEVLIQRLIANLVSNAIDASATDAKIRVELVRLIKTEASRDWLRIRIIDEGEGIRTEDLNRVFTPYFTTKNRGDKSRGFGLGLAICRKIVNLHGGNLSIASQVKKGTTVQIDLPSRQLKQASPQIAA